MTCGSEIWETRFAVLSRCLSIECMCMLIAAVTVVVLKPDFVPSSVGRRQCPETPQKQSPGTHLCEFKGPWISDIDR